MQAIREFFAMEFMPHGHCYFWKPEIVWLNVVSDALIALAYFSIPITLLVVARKRRDLPFTSLFLMFGAFIVLCGTTHLFEVWNVWHGDYHVAGVVKAVTALVSVFTAILLVKIVPTALSLSSPEQLERANRELQTQAAARDRAQTALERERHFLNTLLESLDVGIVACDANGRLSLFNRTTREYHGLPVEPLPPEEWAGHYDLYQGDGITPLALEEIPLFQALNHDRVRTVEMSIVPKGQPARLVRVNGAPIIDSAGHKLGAVVAMHDVTQERRNGKALQRRDAILAAVAAMGEAFLKRSSAAPHGVEQILARLGSATGVSRVYVFENHLSERGELLASQRYEFTAPGIEPKLDWPGLQNVPWDQPGFKEWREHLSNGEVVQGAIHNLAPGVRPLLEAQNVKSLVMVPIFVGEEWWGCIGFDDCERGREWSDTEVEALRSAAGIWGSAIQARRAKESLARERSTLAQRVSERTAELTRANEQLASASRAKDEFLASMSHELRTPLNAILTLTESLQEGVYGSLGEEQRKPLGTVAKSGQHLLDLINDILDLSKIAAGKLELNLTAVQVEEVCQAALALVAGQAAKKHHELTCRIDPALRVVRADTRRLRQILVNLLSNAVKFTPSRGRIQLLATADAAARQVHFTVSDSGIGIPQDRLQDIFEPFHQLDSSLSRQYSGTGLGLALVLRMANAHGGQVTVGSEEGAGSAFTVSLPWEEMTEAGPLDTSSDPAPRRGEVQPEAKYAGALILLVDDNEENREALTMFLQSRGWRVAQAFNGKEAIERAQALHPDIVLMDVQMPVMNGLEAMRCLRDDASHRDLPIIALTSLAMPEDEEQCRAAGADTYMTKPVNLKGLEQTIRKLLRKNIATPKS